MATALHGDDYEWDDQKADQNKQKHGISFEEAAEAFSGPDHVDHPNHNKKNDNLHTLVPSKKGLLFIVSTLGDEEEGHGYRTRLISARLASEEEEDFYNAARERKA